MKKSLQIFLLLFVFAMNAYAQEPVGYQKPPTAIAALIDAPATPGVSISPDRKWMLLLEQPGYPSIEEVAQPELRLAGIRINPRTNGQSRSGFTTGLVLKSISGNQERAIQRLPANARIQYVSWSPDASKLAFIHTSATGMELWTVDAASATARMLTNTMVNGAMGMPYVWLNNDRMVCAMIPADRGAAPAAPATPSGPIVQANEGKAAPVRTFQDLLTDAHDEALFEYYATSQLAVVDVAKGGLTKIGAAGIISDFNASPDGNYLLVTTLQKPFSYLVPGSRFPQTVAIWDTKGQVVKVIARKPLMDNLPQGFDAVPTGPRSFSWRADAPASLYWVEAQDGGDPRKEADVRDKMFSITAPFSETPKEGISFSLRYRGVTWGSGNLALAYEGWWQKRRQVTSTWQPANAGAGKEMLFDRSTEDRYNDPGTFVTETNTYGRSVLLQADGGKTLYLTGQGASKEGNQPFVDRFDRSTKQSKRLWHSQAPYYEMPVAFVDIAKGTVITRRESVQEPPNYFLRNFINNADIRPLTTFKNPYAALSAAPKELVRYKRSDGVEMTGTLYLPAGYDKQKDGPLPMLMWAYPREFKSADAAGQVSGSPYEFIRLNWGSPLYWLTQGYAIFDDFSMPIIGEGDAEPNETFVTQLRDNAESAINRLVEMGVADRRRIAVGGHSYGAFMTANLLAHTDLFAAGIARSGAYNRTLTPFGFQSEERSLWQAPEVYFNMSPFNFADKIKTPILLLHGEADNNSGTFPIQSERFYAALKGHGATVRYVVLPSESHGYRARESVLHTLWEMDQWLDKHVKNRQSAP